MRLGDMLLSAKVVTELQLSAAIAEQRRWGGKLGQVLVRMGALTEDLLVMALCRQLNLPRADLDAIHAVPEALKERIDRATCERYHVLPLAYVAERRSIQLAMSDPFDVVAADDLTRMLGTRLEPFLAGDTALANAIRRLYAATSSGGLAHFDAEPMALTDNAGNMRSDRPRSPSAAFALPAAMGVAIAATPTPKPAATPTGAMAPGDFATRVDEQARTVRAVAELLIERGVIRPDELKR